MDRGQKWMLILAIIVVTIGLIWTYLQWGECRDEGFSVLYCLKHIT